MLSKTRTRKLVHSNHVEANGESKLDNNMPTFKTDLAGNQKTRFYVVLDSGAEVSLIHMRLYNT